jgi:hypothetical protein
MDLPALLPKKLGYVEGAEQDAELFATLVKKTADLVAFFKVASDDETWCERHQPFFVQAISWMTRRQLENRVESYFATSLVNSIYQHISQLKSALEYNLNLKVEDEKIPISSLILGTQSPYFDHLFRVECLEKNKRELVLKHVDPEVAKVILELVHGGSVDLFRKNQAELTAILKLASQWELRSVSTLCQNILKKYVNGDNVIEELIKAHREHWDIIKHHAIDVFNKTFRWSRLVWKEDSSSQIVYECFDFSDRAETTFVTMAPWITHLVFKGKMTSNPHVIDVMKQCPRLVGVDLSGSDSFSEHLLEMPHKVVELDLSQCLWLNEKELRRLIAHLPQISRLILINDVQLTWPAWSELIRWSDLQSLDISLCHQVTDDDFKIILQATLHLIDFKLNGCKKLTDSSFAELSRSCSKLRSLSVVNTQIEDSGLVEIASRLRQLTHLNLSNCHGLSARGLSDAIKASTSLKQIELADSKFAPENLSHIRDTYPLVKIITKI